MTFSITSHKEKRLALYAVSFSITEQTVTAIALHKKAELEKCIAPRESWAQGLSLHV